MDRVRACMVWRGLVSSVHGAGARLSLTAGPRVRRGPHLGLFFGVEDGGQGVERRGCAVRVGQRRGLRALSTDAARRDCSPTSEDSLRPALGARRTCHFLIKNSPQGKRWSATPPRPARNGGRPWLGRGRRGLIPGDDGQGAGLSLQVEGRRVDSVGRGWDFDRPQAAACGRATGGAGGTGSAGCGLSASSGTLRFAPRLTLGVLFSGARAL